MYLLYILIIIFLLIIFWTRKSTAKTDFESIHLEREKSHAPKILYLRSFNVDRDDNSNGNMSILHLFPKELDLAKVLINLNYHLIAVGNPSEDLPEIGFHRKKFGQDDWHSEMIKLMDESKLIIVRIGFTESVLWEIGKLLELNHREKLIVWTEMGYENLQNVQEARYNVFKRKVFEKFSEKFPLYNKFNKFLISETKNDWISLKHIKQTPIYKKIYEQQAYFSS